MIRKVLIVFVMFCSVWVVLYGVALCCMMFAGFLGAVCRKCDVATFLQCSFLQDFCSFLQDTMYFAVFCRKSAAFCRNSAAFCSFHSAAFCSFSKVGCNIGDFLLGYVCAHLGVLLG